MKYKTGEPNYQKGQNLQKYWKKSRIFKMSKQTKISPKIPSKIPKNVKYFNKDAEILISRLYEMT